MLAGPGRLRLSKSGIILFITAAIFIIIKRKVFSQEVGEKDCKDNRGNKTIHKGHQVEVC